MSILKLFSLGVFGVLAGAALAVTTPQVAVSAEVCKCDDWSPGEGSYTCNWDQTKCVSGTEICLLRCG